MKNRFLEINHVINGELIADTSIIMDKRAPFVYKGRRKVSAHVKDGVYQRIRVVRNIVNTQLREDITETSNLIGGLWFV